MKTFAVLLLSALVMSSCQQTEPLIEETKVAWLSPQTLPIGDGRVTNYPSRGNVFSCPNIPNIGGAFQNGPWIKNNGTFDITAKAIVDGNQLWSGWLSIYPVFPQNVLHINSNGLPNHPTGNFPIAWWDDAYTYDRNPNQIRSTRWWDINMPPIPIMLPAAKCVPAGAIGMMYSGAVLYSAVDGQGKDAVAHEVQDGCQGHPAPSGEYHYHNLSRCLDDSGWGHSKQLGVAFDGFGIFGFKGENGQDVTNYDLDECHGHAHWVPWGPRWQWLYHYHATKEYPYTIGCLRGDMVPGTQN